MKIVENWRSAWKFISVQIAVIAAAVQGAVLAFPAVKDYLSDTAVHAVGLLLLVSIVVGRLVQQPSPPCPPQGP